VAFVTSGKGLSHSKGSSVGEGSQLAGHGTRGDHVVGKLLKNLHNISASGTGGGDRATRSLDGSGQPVLTESIIDAKGPVTIRRDRVVLVVGARETSGTSFQDSNVPSGDLSSGSVIEVQGVNTVLAVSLGAVSAFVASITLATHGGVSVPKLVAVTVVSSGQLGNRLAGTVTRARGGEARARSTLAGNTIIAIEALALTSTSIAGALVGALHVVVSRVSQRTKISVLHLGELLSGTVRVHGVIIHDVVVGTTKGAIHIKISLRGINVGQTKLASALVAVITLPVAVADAHIISSALSVTIASIGTLSVNRVSKRCGDQSASKQRAQHIQ